MHTPAHLARTYLVQGVIELPSWLLASFVSAIVILVIAYYFFRRGRPAPERRPRVDRPLPRRTGPGLRGALQ